VVGAGVAAKTIAGAAGPALPPRTAAQLLVDLETANLDGLSGTVVEKANLGLPPAITTLAGALGGSQGSSTLTSLVAGKHTLRVWYSGPEKARVSLRHRQRDGRHQELQRGLALGQQVQHRAAPRVHAR